MSRSLQRALVGLLAVLSAACSSLPLVEEEWRPTAGLMYFKETKPVRLEVVVEGRLLWALASEAPSTALFEYGEVPPDFEQVFPDAAGPSPVAAGSVVFVSYELPSGWCGRVERKHGRDGQWLEPVIGTREPFACDELLTGSASAANGAVGGGTR